MNLHELNILVQRELDICKMNHKDPASLTVSIALETVSSVGTPSTTIKRLHQGFDWDSGKMLIYPEKDLMLANYEHLALMRKEAEEIGHTSRAVRDLKRQIKKLEEKFKRIDKLDISDIILETELLDMEKSYKLAEIIENKLGIK